MPEGVEPHQVAQIVHLGFKTQLAFSLLPVGKHDRDLCDSRFCLHHHFENDFPSQGIEGHSLQNAFPNSHESACGVGKPRDPSGKKSGTLADNFPHHRPVLSSSPGHIAAPDRDVARPFKNGPDHMSPLARPKPSMTALERPRSLLRTLTLTG